jgi:two-component system nitrogen regulation response regulator GlnG
MASGREIHMEDMPPELVETSGNETTVVSNDWKTALKNWSDQQLMRGTENILDEATPAFEKIMIESALRKTGGRRQMAAKLLGWGRNTLTRKIRELNIQA